jgi:hypothetical protein
MRKSLISLVVALTLVGLGWYALLYCPPGRPCRCNYERVQVGMSLQEVEAFLGPGTEIGRDRLPGMVRPKPGVVVPKDPPGGPYRTQRDYPVEVVPVVQGDRFFEWPPARPPLSGGLQIIVAFRDGRVCDKTYWEPSL